MRLCKCEIFEFLQLYVKHRAVGLAHSNHRALGEDERYGCGVQLGGAEMGLAYRAGAIVVLVYHRHGHQFTKNQNLIIVGQIKRRWVLDIEHIRQMVFIN